MWPNSAMEEDVRKSGARPSLRTLERHVDLQERHGLLGRPSRSTAYDKRRLLPGFTNCDTTVAASRGICTRSCYRAIAPRCRLYRGREAPWRSVRNAVLRPMLGRSRPCRLLVLGFSRKQTNPLAPGNQHTLATRSAVLGWHGGHRTMALGVLTFSSCGRTASVSAFYNASAARRRAQR